MRPSWAAQHGQARPNLGDVRALVQGLKRKGVRVSFGNRAWTSPARTRPWPSSCSPSWVPSLSSNAPSSGDSTGRHRSGQAARRPQKTEKDPQPERASRIVLRAGAGVPKPLLARVSGSAGSCLPVSTAARELCAAKPELARAAAPLWVPLGQCRFRAATL